MHFAKVRVSDLKIKNRNETHRKMKGIKLDWQNKILMRR